MTGSGPGSGKSGKSSGQGPGRGTGPGSGRGPAFACQRCGDCCRGRGGAWVNGWQIDGLAGLMGLGRVEFVERFFERDGPVWAVKSGADGYCLFYEPLDRACLIEPMKPLSCLAWPFYRWPLGGPGAFAEAQNLCPALAELEWPDYLAAFEAAGAGGPPPKSLKEATLGYRGGGRFFA